VEASIFNVFPFNTESYAIRVWQVSQLEERWDQNESADHAFEQWNWAGRMPHCNCLSEQWMHSVGLRGKQKEKRFYEGVFASNQYVGLEKFYAQVAHMQVLLFNLCSWEATIVTRMS
jgi:hypothetical protein